MADRDESLSGGDTEVETSHSRRQQNEYNASSVVKISLKPEERVKGGVHTEPFLVGDQKWRLFYFPTGNGGRHFSVYIEAIDDSPNYKRDAKFRMAPQTHLKRGRVKLPEHFATHNFSKDNKDWGFAEFIRLEDLYDASSGFLDENKVFHILVETKVTRDTSFARKDSGYIGIMNQGATCYMNSLLQALFHLPYFRRVVYNMPAEGGVTIPYALQALFYRLQTSSSPVSTKQLTKSFGWDADDSFSQHDVTEFNRVLIDTLEMKMKGTPVEGTMEKLFRGQFINYIQCVDVDYKSERPEYFYDLQMQIEGCQNIYDSFRKYVLPEMLSGENKYQAEGHGLQDARRGIRFKTFPDILELNLNRFKQDFIMDRIQKINDRFEFYPVIDLKDFFDVSDTESSVYHLHGVLVHSGTMQGGHYNAFLRPTQGPAWYQFDDSSVRKSSEMVAVDDNFGESTDMRVHSLARKFSSAYMLIYVRDSRVKEIFKTVGNEEIPNILIERLEREKAELIRKREEREEADRCVDVCLITQEMLNKDKQEGFDMVNIREIPRVKLRKEEKLYDYQRRYAEENGIDNPEKIRFWDWISRQNQTDRVDYPTSMNRTFGEMDKYSKKCPSCVRLFVEVSDRLEEPFFDPVCKIKESPKRTVIIFFKYFDLKTQLLRHVGHDIFRRGDIVEQFVPVAKRLAGIPENESIRLYEEVKPLRIDSMDLTHTLDKAELITGDIIIVEDDFPDEERSRFANPHVSQFFDNILNRIVIQFRSLDEPSDESKWISIVLNKKLTHAQVLECVAERLEYPKNKIRLSYSPNGSRTTNTFPLTMELAKIAERSSPPETLYFQKMDITMEEFKKLKQISVLFWEGARRYSSVDLLAKRDETFGEILRLLEKEVSDSLKGTKKLRLYLSTDGFLGEIPPLDAGIDRVTMNSSFIAEEIQEEELHLEDGDRLIKVMHYDRSSYYRDSFHGVPFFVLVRQNDTYGDVRERIRSRLKVKREEFEVWKFAMINGKSPSVLPSNTPEETPFANFISNSTIGIGLEHRRREKNYGGGWKEKGIAFKQ